MAGSAFLVPHPLRGAKQRLSPSGALSARGISNCNREDLGKRWPTYEGPIDKSLSTKEALAVRLRKLPVDGEKTLQGVAELAYQQSF